MTWKNFAYTRSQHSQQSSFQLCGQSEVVLYQQYLPNQSWQILVRQQTQVVFTKNCNTLKWVTNSHFPTKCSAPIFLYRTVTNFLQHLRHEVYCAWWQWEPYSDSYSSVPKNQQSLGYSSQLNGSQKRNIVSTGIAKPISRDKFVYDNRLWQ